MNILITGGSGLIGKALVSALRKRNHTVRILTRKKTDMPDEFNWNPDEGFIDSDAFENLDSIIHLAGANISQRWSYSYKKELFESRISTANLLMDCCIKHNIRLQSFISASGINYYGTFTADRILSEEDGIIQHDFLADLCEKWEAAAEKFRAISERVVCVRTAMVLAKNGGALPLLEKTVKLNLGAAVGSGRQWMNWIHLEDLANLYVFAVENAAVDGKLNAVADEISTNKDFMKTLAHQHGKFFLPVAVPAFILKLIFGEMSSIILEGTRAGNEKIKSLGFDFKFPELETALKNLAQ